MIEQIDDARASLLDCRLVEAVHSARKDLKKVRAILNLVDKEVSVKAGKRLAKVLREPAKRLAAPRDLYVLLQTLTNLARQFKGQLDPDSLKQFRDKLRRQLAGEMHRFTRKKSLRKVERELKRVRQNACALNLRNKGWRAIKTGLKASYSRGLLAWEKARDSASPKKLHSWRKHVKELGYQLALLCKVWPEQIQAMRDQLDLLGEHLGDHHDLCMLRDAANTTGADERGSIDLESLNTLIDQRHAALIVEALALGAKFYAEKPSIFCRRLAIYWKNWRRNGRIAAPTAN